MIHEDEVRLKEFQLARKLCDLEDCVGDMLDKPLPFDLAELARMKEHSKRVLDTIAELETILNDTP